MRRLEISRSGLLRAAGFGGLGLFLAWLGHASVATSNAHEYPFNDPLSFRRLIGDMLAVPLSDVVSTARSNPMQGPASNVLMISSVVLAMAAVLSRNVDVRLLIAASVVAVPYGLIGLLKFVGFAAVGEWLAAGFVVANAFGIWSVLLWLVTARQLRRPEASETAIAAV